MNKIVTLNALRGNSYSLFRKIPLMINMGVCAFCLVPAMVFAENTHEVTVLNAQQQTRKAVGVVTDNSLARFVRNDTDCFSCLLLSV